MRRTLSLLGWTIVLSALLAASAASGSSIAISPSRITLTEAVPIESILLRNRTNEPAVFQADIYLWEQMNGEDVLTPTTDIVVTPPIVEIPPLGQRYVRLGIPNIPEPGFEVTYRLLLKEVVNRDPGSNESVITFAFQFSLPVFVRNGKIAPPKVEWALFESADGEPRIAFQNNGASHVQVRRIQLFAKGRDEGHLLSTVTEPAYILPGQEYSWRVRTREGASLEHVKLSAETDIGTMSTELSLQPTPGTPIDG